jgi:pimeloyl-ACP methyl ester carboxylesterase
MTAFKSTLIKTLLMTAPLLKLLAAPAIAHQSASAPANQEDTMTEDLTAPLVLKDQGSFFIGGNQILSGAVNGLSDQFLGVYPRADYIQTNQMYVQFQVPKGSANKIPIVLVHGGVLSGKTWEDTPDGRMGWAEYFVRKHHAVYVPDQPSRARSGFDPTIINEVHLGVKPPSALPNTYVIGRTVAWDAFRFGPAYPTPFPDEQFPVEAIGELGNQIVPDLTSQLPDPNPAYENLANLAIMAGNAVLVGHSQSGLFPEQAALVNSAGIKGMITIEPRLCPALSSAQIQILAKIPILIMYGDHIVSSALSSESVWRPSVESCKTYVAQLQAAGGNATLVELPRIGIFGNSHMLMQDRNNLQVADYILSWIDKHVNQEHSIPLVGKNRNASD